MRVNILCGDDLCGNNLPQLTLGLLAENLPGKGVALTEEHAEIVHIIGAWNAATTAAAKRAAAQAIPFVHTPLGSLAPWHKPAAVQLRLSSAAHAVVASGIMEQKLLGKRRSDRLQLIPNAVTTSTTTAGEMAEAYAKLYARLIEENDAALRESVDAKIKLLKEDDENIVKICRELLYAQCLCRQRTLPKSFLAALTDLFTRSDYDEERFDDVLKLINLHAFTARLERAMQQLTGLKEGFMPVAPSSEKEAREIMKIVIEC
ncbi:MAG: hypothetical protein LUC49_01760 [Prevotella sp.]|nr:hypothetical protein [Prevotella sp.]